MVPYEAVTAQPCAPCLATGLEDCGAVEVLAVLWAAEALARAHPAHTPLGRDGPGPALGALAGPPGGGLNTAPRGDGAFKHRRSYY